MRLRWLLLMVSVVCLMVLAPAPDTPALVLAPRFPASRAARVLLARSGLCVEARRSRWDARGPGVEVSQRGTARSWRDDVCIYKLVTDLLKKPCGAEGTVLACLRMLR